MSEKKVSEPGEFVDENVIVLDKPTDTEDFDGVSQGFLRFNDLEDERYEEKLEQAEEEMRQTGDK